MYAYHFHAEHHKKNVVHHFDGIDERSMPVIDPSSYEDVKAAVAREMVSKPKPHEIIITSFTLLHKGPNE